MLRTSVLLVMAIAAPLALHAQLRGGSAPPRLVDPIPGPIPAGTVHIRLEPVATGLTAPILGVASPVHADRMLIAEQTGLVWALDVRTQARTLFMDLSPRLVPLGVFGSLTYDERGLLGLALHPQYASNGLLYTYTSEPAAGAPDFSTMPGAVAPNHHSVIAEWRVNNPGVLGATPDPTSRRELLRIDQPQFNHNGGTLAFGPDNLLYISLGDGGGADDQDGQNFVGQPIVGHGQDGNGQKLSNPFGAILRIDPQGSNSANGAYGVPAGNPFVGAPGATGEIFAYGFRNPYRFSFDPVTGALWAGDAGQNDVEEVNLVTAGANYGWNEREGTFYFNTNGTLPGYVSAEPPAGAAPGPFVDPVAQYDHDEGLGVVGGFVYRGAKIPALQGRYVFGDFAKTFSSDGRLFYLNQSSAVVEFNLVGQSQLGLALLGFGRDAAGELYALANQTGTPFGTTGVVLRITTKMGDINADGMVTASDLGLLLGAWGSNNPPADLNGDRTINAQDLGLLLGAWG